jgi:hypothetical protein
MRKDLKRLRTTFTPIYADVMDADAWRAMEPAARALHLEMKRLYNREKQQPVYMSARHAARLLGVIPRTAVKALAMLEHYGFTVKVADGYLGANGRGIAAQWRLTDEPCNGKPATLDFKRWHGTPFSKAEPRSENDHRPVVKMTTYARGQNDHRPNRKPKKTGIFAKATL